MPRSALPPISSIERIIIDGGAKWEGDPRVAPLDSLIKAVERGRVHRRPIAAGFTQRLDLPSPNTATVEVNKRGSEGKVTQTCLLLGYQTINTTVVKVPKEELWVPVGPSIIQGDAGKGIMYEIICHSAQSGIEKRVGLPPFEPLFKV